jgi:cytochrome c oxidase subunit II
MVMSTGKLLWLGGAALAVLAAGGFAAATSADEPRVVKLQVKKFEYIPPSITLKKGEPVIIELTTLDRLHGFVVQDLKLHADVPPNKTVRIPLTPDVVGTHEIACDIFCGTGHEGLRGTIVVTE